MRDETGYIQAALNPLLEPGGVDGVPTVCVFVLSDRPTSCTWRVYQRRQRERVVTPSPDTNP